MVLEIAPKMGEMMVKITLKFCLSIFNRLLTPRNNIFLLKEGLGAPRTFSYNVDMISCPNGAKVTLVSVKLMASNEACFVGLHPILQIKDLFSLAYLVEYHANNCIK